LLSLLGEVSLFAMMAFLDWDMFSACLIEFIFVIRIC